MIRFLFILFSIIVIFSCEEKKAPKIKLPKPKIIITNEGKIIPIDTTIYDFTLPVVKQFYALNNYKTIWLASKERTVVISFLKNCEEEGLFLNDFDIEKIKSFERQFSRLSNEELIAFDIKLTQNLSKYIGIISSGKLNPLKLYNDWDLKINKTDTLYWLKKISIQDSAQFYLKKLPPQHIIYSKLKKGLALINTFPKKSFHQIEIAEKIKPFDTSEIIIEIKKRLIYWKDLKKQDSLTAIYDVETKKAVLHFQKRHGLAQDGVIGKSTIAMLNVTQIQRKKQIIANMERWRWYPKKFEKEYIIVNIPEYVLHTVFEKDTTNTHFVIVGTHKRKTPILTSKLTHVVFNPTWTVPPTILKEDIIPAAAKDRTYFAKKNITIYNSVGNIVEAENWNPEKAKSYRYVQRPGSFNSLGRVKILFPNRFLVYLHDTNHRDYFTKSNRSLSSGCVRVQNPIELASYILADTTKYSLNKIKDILTSEKTTSISLKKSVYLHQLYWTAWENKGELFFRNDIYNLDFDLYDKLHR